MNKKILAIGIIGIFLLTGFAALPTTSTSTLNLNQPPTVTLIPYPATVKIFNVATFSAVVNDPDGDNIYYKFNFGHQAYPLLEKIPLLGRLIENEYEWEDAELSDLINAPHMWITPGTFKVKVKVKDDPNGDGNLSDGLESDWSEISVKIKLFK